MEPKATFTVARERSHEDPSKDTYVVSNGREKFTVSAEMLARLQAGLGDSDRFIEVPHELAHPDPTHFIQRPDGVIRERTAEERTPVEIQPTPPVDIYPQDDARAALPPKAGGYPMPGFVEAMMRPPAESPEPAPDDLDDEGKARWAALGGLTPK